MLAPTTTAPAQRSRDGRSICGVEVQASVCRLLGAGNRSTDEQREPLRDSGRSVAPYVVGVANTGTGAPVPGTWTGGGPADVGRAWCARWWVFLTAWSVGRDRRKRRRSSRGRARAVVTPHARSPESEPSLPLVMPGSGVVRRWCRGGTGSRAARPARRGRRGRRRQPDPSDHVRLAMAVWPRGSPLLVTPHRPTGTGQRRSHPPQGGRRCGASRSAPDRRPDRRMGRQLHAAPAHARRSSGRAPGDRGTPDRPPAVPVRPRTERGPRHIR